MPKFIDLTGRKLGELTVMRRAENRTYSNGHHITQWTCLCSCGKALDIPSIDLRPGKGRNGRTSCGCKPPRLLKMISRRYGKLVVVDQADGLYKGKRRWKCQCDCGKTTVVLGSSLYRGATKSCGCLWEERKLERGLAEKHRQYILGKIHAKGTKRRKRSIPFELSFDEFVRIKEQNCTYCGVPPSQVKQAYGANGNWICNGIDRIDSNIGYISGNCTACCEPCNQAKNNRTVAHFVEHARRIVDHQSRQEIKNCSLNELSQ